MLDSTTRWVDPHEEEELEEAGTRLLRAAGVFRRGGAVQSPRAEAERRIGCVPWDAWVEARVREAGCPDMPHLIEVLARLAQLTAEQQIMLELWVDDYSYRDIARMLRLTLWRVRTRLGDALLRCRRRADGPPASPRALYWQEVAQKRASIYRAPVRWRSAGRRLAAFDRSQRVRTQESPAASEGATVSGITKGQDR
jgi:DNA-binding CsgD family transcriptional regulator